MCCSTAKLGSLLPGAQDQQVRSSVYFLWIPGFMIHNNLTKFVQLNSGLSTRVPSGWYEFLWTKVSWIKPLWTKALPIPWGARLAHLPDDDGIHRKFRTQLAETPPLFQEHSPWVYLTESTVSFAFLVWLPNCSVYSEINSVAFEWNQSNQNRKTFVATNAAILFFEQAV